MSRINSTSATPVAAQAALTRVTRGARREGEEPASDVVVSVGPSPAGEEEGSVVMTATILACVVNRQTGNSRHASTVMP